MPALVATRKKLLFTDVPASRRRNMAAVRSKGSRPEMAVRRGLHALGFRYRLHDRNLPGTPDMVFASRRAVVEVRGCLWHLHRCPRAALPLTRAGWWAEKLAANRSRDERNEAALNAAGWTVLVAWECEIRANPDRVLSHLAEALTRSDAPASRSAKDA